MFLDIANIPGESNDTAYTNKVDVLAWSWGMSQSGTMHLGTGGGAGKVTIQDLSITKYVDKSSPMLMLYCARGTKIDSVKLIVRKAGGTTNTFIKITLLDVIVASASTGGSGGEDRLTENVTLNFALVRFDYFLGTGGTPGSPITFGWDIPKNESTTVPTD